MCSDPRLPSRRARVALLVLVAAAAAVAPGCGKKGPPLPPLRTVPLAAKDLEVQQQGRSLLLDFGYPATTVGGQPLGGVDAVEVWEHTRAAGVDGALPTVETSEFAVAAKQLLALRGAELAAAVTGDRLQVRLPLPEPVPADIARFFAVKTVKGEETSDFSNRAGIVPVEPPAPPSDLAATATAEGIELTWQAPADSEGFEVFRRLAFERGYGDPIASVAGDARRHVDATARLGQRYIYTVRSLARETPKIYTAAAGEREIEYVDRFPPPLPEDFVALPEQGSVRLRWDAVAAEDLAGYVLYRRDPRGEYRRITEDPIRVLEHLDTGLVAGFTYDYRIQTIDQLGNASERSAPVSATPR